MHTLKGLAQAWAKGEISLPEVVASSKALVYPVKHVDDDGVWWDGEQDNTFDAVYGLVGTELTFDQYCSFLMAVTQSHR